MNSQKLDLNRGSAPRKDEAVMAYLCLQQVRKPETQAFKWFCRSQATFGLAVDYR